VNPIRSSWPASQPLARFAWALLLLGSLIVAGNCAKTGDPQPPLVLIPKPATDLEVRQYGDSVILSVSMPVANTDGSPVTTLDRVELLRVTGARNDTAGLPEPEFLKRAEPAFAASVEQMRPLVQDGKLVLREELGSRDRSAFYSRAFRYAVRFVNRKNQTAGLSNQAAIAPIPLPLPPAAIDLAVSQNSIRASWTPPAANADGSVPASLVGYNIFRVEGDARLPAAPLNAQPLAESFFEDRSFEFGKTYRYAVSVVGSAANPYAESAQSTPASVTARDVFDPGPPGDLNAFAEGARVILLWTAPDDPDVAGYRVYRQNAGGERPQRLEPELIETLSYRDEKVQIGTKYLYSVTAVDGHGNEGPAAKTDVEVK
jgi:hypothetical protein